MSATRHEALDHDIDIDFAALERDGYLVREGVVSGEELSRLRRQSDELKLGSRGKAFPDAEGREAHLNFVTRVIEDLPDSPVAQLAKSPATAGFAREYLGESVYMLYITLSYKAENEGTFVWHQDYRAWYEMGCLYPRLLTVFIALDDMTRDNGCLQVIEGSNRAGRLDHVTSDGQAVVAPRDLQMLHGELPTRALECPAGSAVYMHCNLVHSSGVNVASRGPRRAIILNMSAHSARPRLATGHRPIALL